VWEKKGSGIKKKSKTRKKKPEKKRMTEIYAQVAGTAIR